MSGGQTGVDRAALDAARAAGLPVGGWCPAGRWAEDGVVPEAYPLRETPEADPAQRTDWNVRDADATLLLLRGAPAGGTARTRDRARALGRPLEQVDLQAPGRDLAAAADRLQAWLRTHEVRVLNVAGPRESEAPGIGAEARRFLDGLLDPASRGRSPGGPGLRPAGGTR